MARTRASKRSLLTRRSSSKLCERCGAENAAATRVCKSCKGKRFAPTFVKKLEKVNKQFFVQVTETSDESNPKGRNRITLYKWWPGGRSVFHINTLDQWEQVKSIVGSRLAPYLGWKSRLEISKEIDQAVKDEDSGAKAIASVMRREGVASKILKALDFSKIRVEDYDELVEIIKDLAEKLTNADRTLLRSFRRVLKGLKKAPSHAIGELGELLAAWSLSQITHITREVTHRLETLHLFRERVLDDKTYEIRGTNSIHRVLERAMWIIDERYWLMHSNSTLREIVGKELEKHYRRFRRERPDFVCGTVEGKLVVVELKRPSHELKVEDLNQLESYVDLLEKHSNKTVERAILMGRLISGEVKRRQKYRGHQFKILNYAELIDEAERRYSEYLEASRGQRIPGNAH